MVIHHGRFLIRVPELVDLRFTPGISTHPVEPAIQEQLLFDLLHNSVHLLTPRNSPATAQSPRRA